MSHLEIEDWQPEAREWLRKRKELIEWASNLDKTISRDRWTYFHTHTFGQYTHPVTGKTTGSKPIPKHQAMSASACFARWVSRWQSATPGVAPWSLVLYSAEEHKTGNVHLHALSVCIPPAFQMHCNRCRRALSGRTTWRILKESWWIHHGRAVIKPYDPSLGFGAERYVTKYVLDENCLDWGVLTW